MDTRPATPAASPTAARVAPKPARRAWITLPLKTTITLLALLVGAIAICGAIFLTSTRSMFEQTHSSHVSAFAYGIAAALSDDEPNAEVLTYQLNGLKKTPNIEFAMFTDIELHEIAGYRTNPDAWSGFLRQFGVADTSAARLLGQVRSVNFGGRDCFAVTVPVFQSTNKGKGTHITGYLHVGFNNDGIMSQLRFLQAFVLLTCMGVVLAAVPLASLIVRHITVPIQRLASAAHALAGGDLSHRVNLHRSDELGELTEAFNKMADTVQQQQEDIRRINAGLEQTVHKRTAELEKLNSRLTAEISEKEDFLRAVSHDLNAPLRNIAGMASMLMIKYQATLEKDALQRLERIQKNVQVECELINELLELSRIKTRREKIERVNLHELVQQTADGFTSDLETRHIELKIAGTLPVMRCEKSRMRQLFQNFIDNAIKYMREDGEKNITVSFQWKGDEGIFSVADTGMGIAEEDMPHLFHVFRRAKNASIAKIPGKGVGLASVKSIVENYNGHLWVESVQGKGTTFHVGIPRSHFENAQEVAA